VRACHKPPPPQPNPPLPLIYVFWPLASLGVPVITHTHAHARTHTHTHTHTHTCYSLHYSLLLYFPLRYSFYSSLLHTHDLYTRISSTLLFGLHTTLLYCTLHYSTLLSVTLFTILHSTLHYYTDLIFHMNVLDSTLLLFTTLLHPPILFLLPALFQPWPLFVLVLLYYFILLLLLYSNILYVT